jgi:hypothetical protein
VEPPPRSPCRAPGFRNRRYATAGLAAFAILWLASAAAYGRDAEWELEQRETDTRFGFELYQRDVGGSGYDRYRVEAIVEGPIERVIQAVQACRVDDRYLAPGLTRRILVEDEEGLIAYIQMQIALVKDRDVVLRSRWGYDEKSGVYRDEWMTANDQVLPEQKGFVRMKKSEGFWELAAAGENRTRVVYEMHAEPGGYVPAWIANRAFGSQAVGQLATLRRALSDQRTDVAGRPPTEKGSLPN